MAIFFPLFTLLEDFGLLPRIAFQLDGVFQKAGCHGKQALTMCMGFGCNAAGVTACRIIQSPRERLIAILAEKIDDDAAQFLKKLRRYESYHHTFWGWSHYRVVAMETSSGRLVFNRMGQSLKKIFRNIKSAIKKESNEK